VFVNLLRVGYSQYTFFTKLKFVVILKYQNKVYLIKETILKCF